ncbi:putative geraniol 8-hydroxylase [Rosa chinensis]|uniref:Putative geraniol 8-hydroxylase n=1 Tax=Rosa chinensis TaxID=74649 RepID=A0A2P6QX13_ROSCH|nr:geraniol 8-hydroxylase [Rosa chinensis]PRQ38723.1 putative geraniol 8-hydroxylase [Rosa chinensis]
MDFLSCIVLLSLCSLSWFLIQALQRRTRVRLPPGPKPFPLIGNLFELGDKPHLSLTKLSQHYGPIMSLKLGQLTTIVVSSSTMAKEILQTHDQLFCNRTIPDGVRVVADNLIWMPISPRWRKLRKICSSQLFATKVLDAKHETRQVKVQELIDSVNESMVHGVAVDIREAAFKTTLNLLSRTIFSFDLATTESSSSEMAREYKEIVWGVMEEAGKPNLADYFPVLRKLDPQGIRRRFTNYYNRMLGFMEYVIDQRLESRKGDDYVTNNDMLDTLISISEEKNEEDMNNPQVIENLFMALLTAGTDTTSITLEWAMAELLHNPESLSKAQDELDSVFGKGKLIEESEITQLPYLQAIIKETFRLHPTVPFLVPRKAESDVEIGGYIVPKNAQVLVNSWAIGRDPSIWDNPNSFMPERFLGLENQIDVMGRNFDLIPFGGGRRICPGLPLAMKMLHLTLGSLINCFNWKLEDGVVSETINMEDKFGLTLQMAQPLRAVPISYN